LETPTGPVTFWTGGDGEFYLDSQQAEFDMAAHQGCDALEKGSGVFLPAGIYPLSVKQEERSFRSEIAIPDISEPFAELGEIVLPVLTTAAPAGAISDTKHTEDEATDIQPETEETRPVSTAPAYRAEEPVSTSREETVTEPDTPSHEPDTSGISAAQPIWPATTTIHFPFDRATPIASDRPLLDELARFLLIHPEVTVKIEGHTCRLGSEAYNYHLGRRRAETVRQHLFEASIAPWRFEQLASFGEETPVCLEMTRDCLQRNRRAVVLLVKALEN
jgi:outer membrane protein OmpA-like peptidoglycan-associated protein